MLKVGDYIKKYLITKKLGAGAFGNAFLVEKDGLEYVAKVIYKRGRSSQLESIKKERKVLSEVATLSSCNAQSRDYLCIIDTIEDTGYYAIITNYISGSITLTAFIEKHKAFDVSVRFEDVLTVFSKLIASLYKLHKKNIVHGDIKPDNILITIDKNKVKDALFIDYGGACITKVCKAGGTILYASPEVLMKLPNGELPMNTYKKSDVFSLGIVLYELLANRLPSPTKEKFSSSSIAKSPLLSLSSRSSASSGVKSRKRSEAIVDIVPLARFWQSDPFIFIPPRKYKNDKWMDFIESLVDQMLKPKPNDRASSRQIYVELKSFMDKH